MSLFPRRVRSQSSVDRTTDPHQWMLPANFNYRSVKEAKHPKTVIPDPGIFSDALVPSAEHLSHGSSTGYPNPGHLATHLTIIECFIKFKQSVFESEDLEVLDLPSYAESSVTAASNPVAAAARSQARWKTIVRLAVCRFQLFFENIETILRHAAAYNRLGPNSPHIHAAFTADYMPPIDVMLVWYAYMQHPAAYRDDITAHHATQLFHVPLPWEAILAVVDRETLEYTPPVAAEVLFTTTTQQSPNILEYLKSPPPYSDLDPRKSFSIDLAAAVHDFLDTSSFAEKMHSFLWLRSPSLEGTLQRAVAQYGALTLAVGGRAKAWLDRVENDPTLELVWRTHTLYPVAFLKFSEANFGSDVLLFPQRRDPSPDLIDVKRPSEPSSNTDGNSDDDNTAGLSCYCWTCERIRDEDPNYMGDPTLSRSNSDDLPTSSPIGEGSTSRFSRNRFRSRLSSFASDMEDDTLPGISKEQVLNIKADVGFHRFVEKFRQENPSGTTLPTRPPTHKDIAKQKSEKDSKARAGKYYGFGYTVEVIKPAEFDIATGRLLKKEKVKIRRGANVQTSSFIRGFGV